MLIENSCSTFGFDLFQLESVFIMLVYWIQLIFYTISICLQTCKFLLNLLKTL